MREVRGKKPAAEPISMREVPPTKKAVSKPPVRKNAPQRIEFDEGFGAKSHTSDGTLNSIVDRFGVEVPPQLRCAFSAEAENDFSEVLQHISKARVAIEKGHKTNNPLYANIAQRALIELDNAYSEVKFGRPYCVCRICQGNGRGSCTACHETGFQTQAQYDNNPKEFKA